MLYLSYLHLSKYGFQASNKFTPIHFAIISFFSPLRAVLLCFFNFTKDRFASFRWLWSDYFCLPVRDLTFLIWPPQSRPVPLQPHRSCSEKVPNLLPICNRGRRRRNISFQFRLCAVEMRSNEECGEEKWSEDEKSSDKGQSCIHAVSSQMHTTNPSSPSACFFSSSSTCFASLIHFSLSVSLHLPLSLFTHSFPHLPFCLFVSLLLYPCLDSLSRSASSVNRIYRILSLSDSFPSTFLSTSFSDFFIKWFDAYAVCIRESARAIPHTNSSSSKSSSQTDR